MPTTLDLSGRVALVTGASKGIGLATAAALAEAGARVVLSSRKAAALAAAAETIPGASWWAANAGEPDDVRACIDACVERHGRLDILVNNAAANPYFGPLLGLDLDRAQKTVRVNQIGPLLWAQAAWERSMSTGGGVIVNVASIGGMMVEPAIGWYNATKAALIHLTQQLAVEMGPTVRVNAVAPGLVKTDMARALWEQGEERLAATVPLGRLGRPEDIADAVVFLASDMAAWVTGHTLVVDGGMLVRPNESAGAADG